ncbi:MAG: hypothetical protein N2315_03535 [Thermanaerothrix sp.]|nr:hypothetical protein [Thermanaerothrix sp.]
MHENLRRLLKEGPKAVNIGVEQFAQDLTAQNVPVVQMDWRPPAAGADLLSKLRKLKGKQGA